MNTIKRQALIDIDNFKNILEDSDESDFFSGKEIESYGNRKGLGSYAVRYTLKKTLMEMLGFDFNFQEVEILNNDKGRPELYMSDTLAGEVEKKGVHNIHFSLSHSRKRAAVLLIIE